MPEKPPPTATMGENENFGPIGGVPRMGENGASNGDDRWSLVVALSGSPTAAQQCECLEQVVALAGQGASLRCIRSDKCQIL